MLSRLKALVQSPGTGEAFEQKKGNATSKLRAFVGIFGIVIAVALGIGYLRKR